MTYEQALNQLITYGSDINNAYRVLAQQTQQKILPLKVYKQHLKHALNLYISAQIDDDDLTLWATVLINQTAIDTNEIDDFLFALTNDDMMGGISPASIKKMYSLIK
ncbi:MULTISPECIES: hypothetical protein [Pseudoalteromonas]|uniref:hypothetical protein n=1 Tax=Pseudoalteromonas TaxID=53246 RepID=UPI00026CA927|nr:hypothetical protein [Pseudoalteromonas spongiae]ATD01403.1 hypothetical protein PSPO_b1570 [Pseudoalteromonas spongiae UST010723-006]